MKRLLAVSLITLGLSFSTGAQEHTKTPTSTTQSSTTKSTQQRTTRRPTRRTTRRGARRNRPPAAPRNVAVVPWTTFTSPAGRFSVLLPGQPTDKTETIESEFGPYTSHLTILRDPRNVFLIGWVDYDPSFNFNRQSELEMNRDTFVKGVKARLLQTRSVRIDGFQALEFTAENEDKIFKSRVYMVGRRPYQIVIGSPKGEDDSVTVDKFLNSFRVSPN